MENTEINLPSGGICTLTGLTFDSLSGPGYLVDPGKSLLEMLEESTSTGSYTFAPPASSPYVWGGSGTTITMPSPSFWSDLIEEELLVTYSKNEALNIILNEMMDEVEGKVKEPKSIYANPGISKRYYVSPSITASGMSSTTTSPFVTTPPSTYTF